MTLLQIMPVLAYAILAPVILISAVRRSPARPVLAVALTGIAFAAFSAITFLSDGLVQFWLNHTTTLAGNQVWFDLLIAVAMAFFLMVPRARAVGMNPLPWGIAVAATASIALLPMLARLLWLERSAA
ncbi:hypothetical protein ACPVPU_06670 [Sphingomonas sp. CJ99]